MGRAYREFGFDDDIELMNLTYQMQSGKFVNYNEDIVTNTSNENYKIDNIEKQKNTIL